MGLNHRMWPDSNFIAESLKELDLFVNVELFMTDSCQYADIVLLACSSVERSEFRCYPQKFAVFTQPAILMPGCGTPLGTPVENMRALVQTARECQK